MDRTRRGTTLGYLHPPWWHLGAVVTALSVLCVALGLVWGWSASLFVALAIGVMLAVLGWRGNSSPLHKSQR